MILLAFGEEPLATIVSDLPKGAARILVAGRLTSEVVAFAERFLEQRECSCVAGDCFVEMAGMPLHHLDRGDMTAATAVKAGPRMPPVHAPAQKVDAHCGRGS